MQALPELINNLSAAEAEAALKNCCAATSWVKAMLDSRPFASQSDLQAKVDSAFSQLSRSDWLEAFAGHPKIGDINVLRQKFKSSSGWEAGEQAGVNSAGEETLAKLAEYNRLYEKKFGYIFIVCASGKSAEQMLEILESRLPNEPDAELEIAARQQMQITKLRLEKLCPKAQ